MSAAWGRQTQEYKSCEWEGKVATPQMDEVLPTSVGDQFVGTFLKIRPLLCTYTPAHKCILNSSSSSQHCNTQEPCIWTTRTLPQRLFIYLFVSRIPGWLLAGSLRGYSPVHFWLPRVCREAGLPWSPGSSGRRCRVGRRVFQDQALP